MLTCLMLVGSALYAQPATRKYEFEIEKVSLSDAIRQFSMSTGLQILYLPESDAEERQLVGPVKGSYTPEEALTEMLKPTGLKFSWVNERTIGIERPPPPPPPAKVVTPKGRATSSREQRRESAAGPYWVPGLIYKMNVQGKRWMEGSLEDGLVPLVTFDRSAIEQMGASTVADVIKNISQQTYMRRQGTSGAQFAELRGLGSPDSTLVLVNRRRTLPSAANITTNAFDLNTIPLPAVERIEVLLDSGSVAYGTDAIGGIINIVLRKDIPDPEAELQYGTANGGADERRFSFSAGYAREDVKTAFVMDYFEIGELIGAERDRWLDQDYRRFGGLDARVPTASPGNIFSALPANLPGLSSRFAAVPIGSQGNTIADFAPTAGTLNQRSLFQDLAVAPQARRFSATGLVDGKLSDNIAASAEVLYVDRSAEFQALPPLLVNQFVPHTNAFNPFNIPVVVQAALIGIGPQTEHVEAKLLRAVAGLRGAISSWGWEVSLLDTEEDAWNWTDNELDRVRLVAALASPDAAQALDVFNDGPGGSPELLASLIAPRHVRTFGSDGRQAVAIFGGPLFAIGGGEVSAVLGGEWRREAAEFDSTLGSFDRDISAAFAELRVPLVHGNMNVPALEELSLTLAGRWDDYSDSGDVVNPQFGLTWKPHRDVVLRLAHARTFRPASLYELYLPKMPAPVPAMVSDPRRGGTFTSVVLLTGGNRDLVPVEGELASASLTFTPSMIPGLKLMTNAWRVRMDERITFFSPAALVANEAAFSSRVIRAAPTPAEVAGGVPGQLITLDTSRLNLGRLESTGVDFSASYDFDTGIGRLTPALSGTWIDEFDTVDLPGTTKQDRVNIASELGSIVRWRAAATLGWGRGPFSAFAAARYVPSYDDALNGVRTGRVVDSHTTLDVQASIDLGGLITGDGLWQGMRLTLGATNVTDEMPPFSVVNTLAGFDFSQGDLKGRFCYLRLGKTF